MRSQGPGVALTLVSRSRLGRGLALGLVLWGVPLIVVGALPYSFVAVIALAVLGVGNTLVDISTMTLIQRTAVPEVAGRIFGVLESSIVASLALGALTAPALITWLGTRGALLTVGVILPFLALVTRRRLSVIDDAAHIPLEQIAALAHGAVPHAPAAPDDRIPRRTDAAGSNCRAAPRSSAAAITATPSTSSTRARSRSTCRKA